MSQRAGLNFGCQENSKVGALDPQLGTFWNMLCLSAYWVGLGEIFELARIQQ